MRLRDVHRAQAVMGSIVPRWLLRMQVWSWSWLVRSHRLCTLNRDRKPTYRLSLNPISGLPGLFAWRGSWSLQRASRTNATGVGKHASNQRADRGWLHRPMIPAKDFPSHRTQSNGRTEPSSPLNTATQSWHRQIRVWLLHPSWSW